MPKYTTEDLIQYLYHETTDEQNIAIKKAIDTNYELQEKLKALESSRQGLDSILESPREQSVLAILDYANRLAPVEQK